MLSSGCRRMVSALAEMRVPGSKIECGTSRNCRWISVERRGMRLPVRR
jgi:hypothetical protein